MSEQRPQHIVIVRHGESEGDARRAAWERGDTYISDKDPRDEDQTQLGHEQSRVAGLWIAKFILAPYGLGEFEAYYTSPLGRTKQSAKSLSSTAPWIDEPKLIERDRGKVQGITKNQHEEMFPASYRQMLEHPFHWTPPEGESLLGVANRLSNFLDDLRSKHNNALLMSHRDLMWSAHLPLDRLSLEEIEQINTDKIGNSHIFHYTNVHPSDGTLDEDLRWKRSIDPIDSTSPDYDAKWVDLRNNI